jgi:hypothetical protein
VGELQKLGFPRLESMAWSKLARGVMTVRRTAEACLARSEGLLPAGHPDRDHVKSLRAALGKGGSNGGPSDRRLSRELDALARLARG